MDHQTAIGSNKPKVLFLSEVINCNDGIASYCQTLAQGLRERGVEVILVSGFVRSDEHSAGKRQMLQESVTAWHIVDGLKKIPTLDQLRLMKRIIKDNNIRVVNVHGLGMLLLGKLLSILTGVRVVGTYHQSVLGSLDKVLKTSNQKFGINQELYLNLFMPSKLIVLSEESVDFMKQHHIFLKSRIVKVLGGTDLTHFRPASAAERLNARKKFGLSQNDFVCILAGRLAWVKGHDLLITAVRILREAHPELAIKCLFVGSGGEGREAEIKSFAHEGGQKDIDTFLFVGFMSDVREALWAADVFVLPSRFEGFALSVVEAMSTGLVPVRTATGGALDQIVNGKNGYLVPFEDTNALAATILCLKDDSHRQKIAAESIKSANTLFGIDPMIDRMLELYGLKAI